MCMLLLSSRGRAARPPTAAKLSMRTCLWVCVPDPAKIITLCLWSCRTGVCPAAFFGAVLSPFPFLSARISRMWGRDYDGMDR